jgi:protein-L-isoaspartate(D-aspartate) O-methyltransferase
LVPRALLPAPRALLLLPKDMSQSPPKDMPPPPPFAKLRQAMVRRTVERRGVTDPAVLAAMRAVPREEFVPAQLRAAAYADSPLPLAHEQTISQPFIVALQAASLGPVGLDARLLEVGTGSGYGAAVLAQLVPRGTVVSVERVGALARQARERLARLGMANVEVVEGDGSRGWAAGAPYHGIVVTAAGPRIPPALAEQLLPGGALVMPLGPAGGPQQLVRAVKTPAGALDVQPICDVRFVPLIGEAGFDS